MRIFFLSLLFAAAACGTAKKAESDDEVVSILHGTSFGHCRGYCIREALYTADQMTYTQYSRDSVSFPKKVVTEASTAVRLQELYAAIDREKWDAMPERIGCPDCTDAGSEYIEVRTKTGTKRVVFDAHSEPNGLEKVLPLLRSKRRQLEKAERAEEEEK